MGLMQIPRRVDYGLRAVIYLVGPRPGEMLLHRRDRQATRCAAQIFGEDHSRLDSRRSDQIETRLLRRLCPGTAAGERFLSSDVIEAIEGPIAVNACMDEHLGCAQMPRCTMIGVWSEVQKKINEVLSGTTIAGLRRIALPGIYWLLFSFECGVIADARFRNATWV